MGFETFLGNPKAVTALRDMLASGRVPGAPERTFRHTVQLQFHWGEPPPAPDPRTRIRSILFLRLRGPPSRAPRRPSDRGAGVAVDFEADGDFDDFRCGPSHFIAPLGWG